MSYRFIPYSEGGRVQVPSQGYRSDLHYDGEDMQEDGIYMIHPEFLLPDGSVMLEDQALVPPSGYAYMWILLFDRMWDYHRRRAVPGRKCWFMEGSRKVAEATVIEQIGLVHQIPAPALAPIDTQAQMATPPRSVRHLKRSSNQHISRQ